MTTRISKLLSTPVKTFDSAKDWIKELVKTGKQFHFGEDPRSALNEDGSPIFTFDDAEIIDQRLSEVIFCWEAETAPSDFMASTLVDNGNESVEDKIIEALSEFGITTEVREDGKFMLTDGISDIFRLARVRHEKDSNASTGGFFISLNVDHRLTLDTSEKLKREIDECISCIKTVSEIVAGS